MKRLFNIDLLKFLCAVLIVFLHVNTPYHELILPITRCAVPCFFIISGYLIFSENSLVFKERLERSIRNIFHIFIWSTLLFASVRFVIALKNDDFSFLSFRAFVEFILLNENPFGFHLWYIGAYMYTLLIILFFLTKDKLKYIYWLIPLLLLTDLCLGKYSIILWGKEFPYILVRNFLCVGIPYFSIGMLIKQFWKNIQSQKKMQILSLVGVILFSLTSLIENRILLYFNANATRDHYISSTFLAISLFVLFLTIKMNKANIFSILGEKYSLYIYIFHPLFMIFLSVINKYLHGPWYVIYSYLSPVIILVITILFIKLLKILRIIK